MLLVLPPSSCLIIHCVYSIDSRTSALVCFLLTTTIRRRISEKQPKKNEVEVERQKSNCKMQDADVGMRLFLEEVDQLLPHVCMCNECSVSIG